jgi:4-hydroxybenzoate polyprenyltransferase
MPIRNAIIFVAILGIAGIAGLFLIGKLTGIWGLIFLLITGYGYNFPPFKWKNKPVWGIVVSVLGGGMAFFIGCSPYFNGDLVLQVMPYIFALTSVSLLTTVPDMEGDAVAGKKTFALRFGSIPTLRIALISCAFAVISGKVLSDNIIFWSALISLPLFIASTILKDIKIISLTIKYPIFILSVALALEYPWYFILIFGYFLFARWYYKKRFEIEYPSLGAE